MASKILTSLVEFVIVDCRNMIHITNNPEETYELAVLFAGGQLPCSCKKREQATVVGLFGELGAGKTAFTQGVAKAFGIKEQVTSPTFVLEKIYKLSKGFSYEHLVHIDAYRLDDSKEMSALGWNEVLQNSTNIIFIEWPEKVAEILPEDMIKIYFEAGKKENERKIKILC